MTDDEGSVTVEAALVLSAVVVVLLLALTAIAAAVDHVRCVDAAAQAARLAIRGDLGRAQAAARQAAPPEATITIRTTSDTITVTIDTNHPLFPTHATAHAVLEPGVTP
ncbi:TadE family type IV pilus minor pilin [Actinokineospora cianjurensis]|uniref:TadE-like protein n=1 Tax=Actinokineospora cianjurensis TaxID=585224 RepID=A0A421B631_9PSEU|nr:TadE family type IV pilus minor pilin [Actinokineospora cianjurensis]RLK59881.1 hypothetical protein CLV68_0369 [Actinokineospora cianjurensis]